MSGRPRRETADVVASIALLLERAGRLSTLASSSTVRRARELVEGPTPSNHAATTIEWRLAGVVRRVEHSTSVWGRRDLDAWHLGKLGPASPVRHIDLADYVDKGGK